MIGQFTHYLEQMSAERDWEKLSFVTFAECNLFPSLLIWKKKTMLVISKFTGEGPVWWRDVEERLCSSLASHSKYEFISESYCVLCQCLALGFQGTKSLGRERMSQTTKYTLTVQPTSIIQKCFGPFLILQWRTKRLGYFEFCSFYIVPVRNTRLRL